MNKWFEFFTFDQIFNKRNKKKYIKAPTFLFKLNQIFF